MDNPELTQVTGNAHLGGCPVVSLAGGAAMSPLTGERTREPPGHVLLGVRLWGLPGALCTGPSSAALSFQVRSLGLQGKPTKQQVSRKGFHFLTGGRPEIKPVTQSHWWGSCKRHNPPYCSVGGPCLSRSLWC